MERGWSAKGLLQPLWAKLDGGREELAARAGTQPTNLSSINSGDRNLGWDLARRIADVFEISVLELGAPSVRDDARGSLLLVRLEEEREQAEAGRQALARSLKAIHADLRRIEARLPQEAQPNQEARP